MRNAFRTPLLFLGGETALGGGVVATECYRTTCTLPVCRPGKPLPPPTLHTYKPSGRALISIMVVDVSSSCFITCRPSISYSSSSLPAETSIISWLLAGLGYTFTFEDFAVSFIPVAMPQSSGPRQPV